MKKVHCPLCGKEKKEIKNLLCDSCFRKLKNKVKKVGGTDTRKELEKQWQDKHLCIYCSQAGFCVNKGYCKHIEPLEYKNGEIIVQTLFDNILV